MASNNDHSDFFQALMAFTQLEAKVTGVQPSPEWLKRIKSLAAGLFRIVVMGEIKKGKSSFINAMLGVDGLVPVSSDVATSTIYKICYGSKQEYRVFFKEASGQAAQTISKDELALYGTEAGNPSNEKQVDFIQVCVPSPILRNGLVIIDTPGLGGLFREHKRITYEYVPRADAVFLVTDSVESPIGVAELNLLADLKKITNQIFFIQTKCCVVDKKAREARRENNLRILQDAGFADAAKRYYMVDSKLKFEADEARDQDDLADSGYPAVMQLINQGIQPIVHKILRQKAMLEARPHLEAVAANLETQKKTLDADSAEKRQALQHELDELEKQIQSWEKEQMPAMLESFQSGMKKIQRDAEESLNDFRPNGNINQKLDEMLTNVKKLDELKKVNSKIATQLPEMLSEYYLKITRTLKNDVTRLLARLMPDSNQCTAVATYDADVPQEESEMQVFSDTQLTRVAEESAKIDELGFSRARNALYGGVAGSAICGAIGGLIGSVIPVVGTVIGSTAGVVIAVAWGGYKGTQIADNAAMEKNISQMRGEISRVLSNFYTETQRKIRNMLEDITEQTRGTLRKYIAEQREVLTEQRKTLATRSHEDGASLDVKRKLLDGYIAQFETIKRILVQ